MLFQERIAKNTILEIIIITNIIQKTTKFPSKSWFLMRWGTAKNYELLSPWMEREQTLFMEYSLFLYRLRYGRSCTPKSLIVNNKFNTKPGKIVAEDIIYTSDLLSFFSWYAWR